MQAEQYRIRKRRGPKKRPGALDFDPKNGSIRYCVGYCPHGDKVLLTREEMSELVGGIKTTRPSLCERVVVGLLQRL